jgi:hypothetical protein
VCIPHEHRPLVPGGDRQEQFYANEAIVDAVKAAHIDYQLFGQQG